MGTDSNLCTFDGRVALVTGAAGNIGFATCRRLAAHGVRIAACDLDASAVTARVAPLVAAGADVRAYAMAFAGSVPVVCAAIFCFGVAAGVYDSNLYAALLDVVSPRYRAAAVGFFGCGGNVLGALGSGLLGGLNGLFGMRASLASLALFALAGALVILLARKSFTRLRKGQET